MLLRSITALVGLALLLSALWGGLFWVFCVTLLAAVLGIREFYRLFPPQPVAPPETELEPQPEPSPEPSPPAMSPTPPAPLSLSLHLAPGERPQWVVEETPAPAASAVATVAEPATAARQPLPVLLGAMWVIALVSGGAAAQGMLHFWAVSLAVLIGGGFIALLWLIAFYRGRDWPRAAAYLVGGPLYVGFLLAHAPLLAQIGESYPLGGLAGLLGPPDAYQLGRNWLILALFCTFATDTGAYLVGRAIGRRPMAPSISPNKTWEGAAGGFLAAIAAAVLLDYLLNLGLARDQWNWQAPLIGATVGLVAQAGDLLESRLKRLSQVKDSGGLMPGHGGLLDRLDSLLLTLPAAYYLAVAVLTL